MEVSTQVVVGSQVKAYFLFIIVINTKTYLLTTYEEKLVLKCKCSSGLFLMIIVMYYLVIIVSSSLID